MDDYCIALLRKIQSGKCAICGVCLICSGFQMDHKRYAEDITLYDLQLLCGPCHARKTGITSHNGTLRTFPAMEVL